jgi:hypothetical protein
MMPQVVCTIDRRHAAATGDRVETIATAEHTTDSRGRGQRGHRAPSRHLWFAGRHADLAGVTLERPGRTARRDRALYLNGTILTVGAGRSK